MKATIEIPRIEDFNKVNELAKQVHKLHVNWRPDLFLSVDKVISKEDKVCNTKCKIIIIQFSRL